MDGRQPTGVMYVNTHVNDSSKEDEYDLWYRQVHFRDVTEPGIFVDATMFHNANRPPADGEGKFLAFYETFWDDVDAATEVFKKHVDQLARERQIHAGTVGVTFGIYKRVALEFSGQRRPFSQSVCAFLFDATDSADAEALGRHYAEHCLGDAMGTGLFHTGSLHERVRSDAFADAAGEQPRFLALYESDLGDPRALASILGEKLGVGALPKEASLRLASSFYRAAP
ncbi:DUF4286 family protein [Myxococcota bacterium]|nr:DUF4286 family protein [Myxococcota bacterium]